MKKERSFRELPHREIEKSVPVLGYARIRPFLPKEHELDDSLRSIIEVHKDVAMLDDPRKPADTPPDAFSLDRIFNDIGRPACNETQVVVFDEVMRSLVNGAVSGVNGCVVAYGATGTGKTFTCFGTQAFPGLGRRLCPALFEQIERCMEKGVSWTMTASFFELYNEKIHDLLSDDKTKVECKLRSSPGGVYVEGLRASRIEAPADASDIILKGETARSTNQQSSKTHAAFVVDLVRSDAVRSTIRKSRITIVDLAGIERSSKRGQPLSSKQVLDQKNVNVSLMSLRRVVDSLTDQKKIVTSAPFRDSVLTWYLSDSIGGNCRCTVIATVSPHPDHCEEIAQTLQFTEKVKHVFCRPVVNEQQCEAAVADLEAAMRSLKAQMQMSSQESSADFGRNTQVELANLEKELSVALAVKQMKEVRYSVVKELVERQASELAEVERLVEGKMHTLREVKAAEREAAELLQRRSETAQLIDEHVLINEKRNGQIHYARQRGKSMLRRIESVEKKLVESKHDEVSTKQRGIADLFRLATELGRQREEIAFYNKTVQSLMIKEKELHNRGRAARDNVKSQGKENNDRTLECELLLTELERLMTVLNSETELKMCAVENIVRTTDGLNHETSAARALLAHLECEICLTNDTRDPSVGKVDQIRVLEARIQTQLLEAASLDSEVQLLLKEEDRLQEIVEAKQREIGAIDLVIVECLDKQRHVSDTILTAERQAVESLEGEVGELSHLLRTAEFDLDQVASSHAAAAKKLANLQKSHVQLERYVTERLFNPQAPHARH